MEAAKIVKVTEGQYRKGLIIPLEFNKVESWQKRLELTRDSIAQELEMAYLSFQQTLDSEDSPEVGLLSLDMREFDISLTRCVDTALTTRPEINLAKLWVEYYRYNKKIEDAKDSFNVDFTGSYGYYQGHFEIEPWVGSSNWYMGVRITKPWGPNTSTTSLSMEEAQARFGETSPTGRQTLSSEFGIMDNMAYLAEKKGAEVALLQAESQLDETEDNITFEVQDAYLKYQKSLFEVKSAMTHKDYRKEELKITRANVLSGVQSYSSLIETLVNLSEAENTYLRALGNYYISLAGLRKATGYGLRI
jgi:outer membrane protein TolC